MAEAGLAYQKKGVSKRQLREGADTRLWNKNHVRTFSVTYMVWTEKLLFPGI